MFYDICKVESAILMAYLQNLNINKALRVINHSDFHLQLLQFQAKIGAFCQFGASLKAVIAQSLSVKLRQAEG